jgi:hypothetical protein
LDLACSPLRNYGQTIELTREDVPTSKASDGSENQAVDQAGFDFGKMGEEDGLPLYLTFERTQTGVGLSTVEVNGVGEAWHGVAYGLPFQDLYNIYQLATLVWFSMPLQYLEWKQGDRMKSGHRHGQALGRC